MRAEIIAIGDELTTGQRLDTNSQWLAERLLEIGVPVAFHTTVGDTLADNVLVFRQACERAEIVVATGGLGPTADDLTRHALAQLGGVPLVQDDASLEHIRALFARRKREMPPTNLIQAQFPQGATPIHNPHGTAPGIDMAIPRAAGKPARIFCLPGVPAEMKEMWGASVSPAIQSLLGVKRVICHYRIKCFGVGESDLEAMLPDLIARDRYPLVGITVHQATITLRITAEGETAEAARASMEPTIKTIQECLGDLIFGEEDEELPDVVVRLLKEQGRTLNVIEPATDGLIAYWLLQCAGARKVVKGAMVRSCDGDRDRVYREGLRVGDIVEWPEFDFDAYIANQAFLGRTSCGTDYCLVIDINLGVDPISLGVALSYPGGEAIRSWPYSAHPEILKPRAAKQALNLLRLHLLGNA
jgi:nicotinamide-nucleotide amidase